MRDEIKITVRFDPARLSKNKRYHPAARRSLQRVSALAAREAYAHAGRPEAAGPVDVTPVVRRARLLDDSNAYHGMEQIRDALFCRNRNGEGVTPDDSPRWFRWLPVEWDVRREWRGREEVEFIIIPRDSASS